MHTTIVTAPVVVVVVAEDDCINGMLVEAVFRVGCPQ